MKAQGKDVISLSAGEPDFATPVWVCEAAIEAIQKGETRYTDVTGTAVLKKAVQAKFLQENGLDYQLSEIIVGTGAKQIIFNALFATLNPGDEVIIPAPYWVSYSDIVLIAGGKPVILECHDDEAFKLSPPKLANALTPQTKWVLLNSPCNPTGVVYTEAELHQLAQVLRKWPNVYILSDDIYEHVVYHKVPYATIAAVDPSLKDRTLTVNGVSKTYAMTGWRIGYAGGPQELIKAMGILQSQSTSNPCSISQAAAVAALNGPQSFRAERNAIFQQRRDFVVAALNQIPGLSCISPEGAFYVYPSCHGILGHKTSSGTIIQSDRDFAEYLLNEWGVAVVPGEAFGLSPYFRISYAIDMNNLAEACRRIQQAVQALI